MPHTAIQSFVIASSRRTRSGVARDGRLRTRVQSARAGSMMVGIAPRRVASNAAAALDHDAKPPDVTQRAELRDADLDPRRAEVEHHDVGDALGGFLEQQETLLAEQLLDARDDLAVVDGV